MEGLEGGKVRESRQRREKSKSRGEIVGERPRGKKIEIGEERGKTMDGRRSLRKWLVGRFEVGRLGRESLAESLSRGHVCRVHR